MTICLMSDLVDREPQLLKLHPCTVSQTSRAGSPFLMNPCHPIVCFQGSYPQLIRNLQPTYSYKPKKGGGQVSTICYMMLFISFTNRRCIGWGTRGLTLTAIKNELSAAQQNSIPLTRPSKKYQGSTNAQVVNQRSVGWETSCLSPPAFFFMVRGGMSASTDFTWQWQITQPTISSTIFKVLTKGTLHGHHVTCLDEYNPLKIDDIVPSRSPPTARFSGRERIYGRIHPNETIKLRLQ